VGAGFTLLLLLHPVVLLNGRRALQEGSMLLFGLLTFWAALLVARRIAGGAAPSVRLWAFFAVASGLCLASKHLGLCFVVAGMAVIAAARLRLHGSPTGRPLIGLLSALAGALAVFLALSPALWINPPARIADLLRVRAELVEAQGESLRPSLAAAGARLLMMPFVEPPQYFETADIASDPMLHAWAAASGQSPFSGLPLAGLAGWAITGLALVGMGWSLAGLRTRGEHAIVRAAPALWWLVTAVLLLVNPLPWQRYYLPLVPPSALLAVLGLSMLKRLARRAPGALPASVTRKDFRPTFPHGRTNDA
jgi:4-amino-4-deoxy-L-arabinose transferase-like glycosyltransferase